MAFEHGLKRAGKVLGSTQCLKYGLHLLPEALEQML